MVPLATLYPPTLRRLVWPAVAEAAVDAGTPVPPDDLPGFARAMLSERQGNVDDALARFDKLAAGPDRLDQVRASVRAAELRLSAGRLKPAEVADILERQAFAWRGDNREAAFRLRAAELRATAGEWRPSLDALRAIEQTFPDQKDQVTRRKAATMQALLAAEGGNLTPLDLVRLAADYADCIPPGQPGTAMARLLADKLTALDLPARVIPVLQGLVRSAERGEARASLGTRLAELLLEGGDAEGAAATLDASDAEALPPALGERRALALARIRAARGNLPAALAGLSELRTDAADELRADLAEKANDWKPALAALSELAARQVPAAGPLAESAQALLLRQANAASRASDGAALAALRPFAPRLDGPRADVFRLLTAAPLAGTADLPRAGVELAAARALPQRLQAAGLR